MPIDRRAIQEKANELLGSPQLFYRLFLAPIEPPGFAHWFEGCYGRPSDIDGALGEMDSYWKERHVALNGYWAAMHTGMQWPDVLRKVGYTDRIAPLQEIINDAP